MVEQTLANLRAQIDACRVCEEFADDFSKPPSMNRGTPGKIMIVGQGPGKTEISRERAFSGQSGRKLDEWLVECGAPEENPRQGIYLTSVTKCYTSRAATIPRMSRYCRHFLDEQIRVIQPAIVISLGQHSYDVLKLKKRQNYQAAICSVTPFEEGDLLISPSDCRYTLVVWPHPSGANRWHNKHENQLRLKTTFREVRKLFAL